MIYDTYAEILLEEILRNLLTEGESPTAARIENEFEDFVALYDISKPLFVADDYEVEYGENSSATKFNNTNNAIFRDLKVLYKHLFKVSDQCVKQFDRWRTEAEVLEKRLNSLNDRITSILLINQDTDGYFNFFQDSFTDASKIDLENSTAYVNLDKQIVSIGTSSVGATRVDLSNLLETDILISVLTRQNLVSSIQVQNSSTKYIVSDINNYWQTRVFMNSRKDPVSIEIKIDLLENKTFSRIDVDLHMSNKSDFVQVTPMYSTDNYSWQQLTIDSFTRRIKDKTSFQFETITTRYIKFIVTKSGCDSENNNHYIYEFGVDEISFYNEAFKVDTDSTLISKPYYSTKTDGTIQEFSKITLETCEEVPTDTKIDYYIAVSNDSTVPIATTTFTSIDSTSREDTTKPILLDFGDLNSITISGINISYNSSMSPNDLINPAGHFTYISEIVEDTATTISGSTSSIRYLFANSNERLLDVQVGSGVTFLDNSLEVWRNINHPGSLTKVRDNYIGWRLEDPYYKTTVYVENPIGYTVDFGGKPVVIDESNCSGKIYFSEGPHSVWIHKTNWKQIDNTTTISGVDSLKSADSLYPYNHKYIVEGFEYPSNYSTLDEQVYRGFDIVAEYLMKEVSIYDLINNVQPSDYEKFAIDYDFEDTGRLFAGSAASNTSPTKVFVIKVDENNSDFINEEFMIRFKTANTMYKYLRFKAVFQTQNSSVTPFLGNYRIKIGS